MKKKVRIRFRPDSNLKKKSGSGTSLIKNHFLEVKTMAYVIVYCTNTEANTLQVYKQSYKSSNKTFKQVIWYKRSKHSRGRFVKVMQFIIILIKSLQIYTCARDWWPKRLHWKLNLFVIHKQSWPHVFTTEFPIMYSNCFSASFFLFINFLSELFIADIFQKRAFSILKIKNFLIKK